MPIDPTKLSESQRQLWAEHMREPFPPGLTRMHTELQFRQICVLVDVAVDQPMTAEEKEHSRMLGEYAANLRRPRAAGNEGR